MPDVCLTVDLEPDCPPYLDGWRGMEEGAPALLELLRQRGVPATFFTTGRAAERHPEVVDELVADGHELGCHGHSHTSFRSLSPEEAAEELRTSAALLRSAAPVTAFRAPYLDLPDAFLPLLVDEGFEIDSSRGRYKPAHWRPSPPTPLRRIPASMTSSALRLPRPVRNAILRCLRSPVVLFVHPWELVDLTGETLRWDCRLGTGAAALEALDEVVGFFGERGARFLRIGEVDGGSW